PVSNESPETEVTVQATPALVPGEANIVRVDSSVTIHHMLASIFGRPTDTISVRSRAGAYHSVTRLPAGHVFPVAVNPRAGPDVVGGPAKPVNMLHKDDPVTLIVRPSGNPSRNAVWTPFHISSANTNTYEMLLQMYLEQIPNDPLNGIPEIEPGVTDINLDNGVNRGTHIDSTYLAPITQKPFVLFPLVTTDNYNQQTKVMGFITVKVNNISYVPDGLKFTGTMSRNIVHGWGGELPADATPAVIEKSPSVVKVLAN